LVGPQATHGKQDQAARTRRMPNTRRDNAARAAPRCACRSRRRRQSDQRLRGNRRTTSESGSTGRRPRAAAARRARSARWAADHVGAGAQASATSSHQGGRRAARPEALQGQKAAGQMVGGALERRPRDDGRASAGRAGVGRQLKRRQRYPRRRTRSAPTELGSGHDHRIRATAAMVMVSAPRLAAKSWWCGREAAPH